MKKKSIKRLTAIMLSALMLQSVGVMSAVTTSAVETQQAVSSATTYTEGDYKYKVSDGKATIIEYNGSDTVVNIPSTLGGYDVIALSGGMFMYNYDVTKVIIPEGVTLIDDETFNSAINLKEVILPESLVSIDGGAFRYSGIESLKLPNGLKSIGSYAFYGCDKLKGNIVIPNGVTKLDIHTFDDCSSLNAILIPDSVKTIAEQRAIFDNCSATVFGSQGSTIQKYCEKNNVKFRVFALDKKNVGIAEGESYTLKTNLNSKELAGACTWISSDESVATVTQDGKVEGLKNGKTTITATTENGIKATCEVKVGTEPESITLSKTKLTLNIGVKYAPKVITTPEVAVTEYTWTSSNESVATVNKFGNITTLAEGTATITATTAGGKTAECEVTVKRMADSVSLSKTKLTLSVGRKYAPKATVNPDTVTTRLTWTSSDESIATVNRYGNITAVGKGVAYITVSTPNKKTASCRVEVV